MPCVGAFIQPDAIDSTRARRRMPFLPGGAPSRDIAPTIGTRIPSHVTPSSCVPTIAMQSGSCCT
ncbi:hypothetical protein I79_000294 [Cricetulus griseus]|uniref:Uncharacterized protein n=1 Tax=Cricetulus griseus TaxID=10029 RepID=G3GRN9_CRIGR|nr:hypothetical protein I79_000294 [Cricetulus griseus]